MRHLRWFQPESGAISGRVKSHFSKRCFVNNHVCYCSSVKPMIPNGNCSLSTVQRRFESTPTEKRFELTPEEAAYYDSRDKIAMAANRSSFTLDEDYKVEEKAKDRPISELPPQKKIALSMDFANVCYDYMGLGSLRQSYFDQHCRIHGLHKWEIDSKGRVGWVLEEDKEENKDDSDQQSKSEDSATTKTTTTKKSFWSYLFSSPSSKKSSSKKIMAKHTHMLGSYNIQDNSWRWIWANPESDTPAKLLQHSLYIHDTLNQFAPEFGQGNIENAPIWMGDVLSRICLAKMDSNYCGYLRVPMGSNLRVYLLVEYEPSKEERLNWKKLNRVLRPNYCDEHGDDNDDLDPIRASSTGLFDFMSKGSSVHQTKELMMDHELTNARNEMALDKVMDEETGLRYSTLLLTQIIEIVLRSSSVGPALLDHRRLFKHFLRHVKAEFKELSLNNGIVLGRKNAPVKLEFGETGMYSTFFAKGISDQARNSDEPPSVPPTP